MADRILLENGTDLLLLEDGSYLLNESSADPGGGSSGNVTWTETLNVTTTSPDLFRSSGYFGRASSVETINADAGSEVYYEFTPAAGETIPGGPYTGFYLAPTSGAPYNSATPNAVAAVSGVPYYIRGNFGLFVYDSSNTYLADTSLAADTDVVRIGFDSTGHWFVKVNGVAVYTSSGTYTDEYLLYVVFNDEGGANKIRSVTYRNGATPAANTNFFLFM